MLVTASRFDARCDDRAARRLIAAHLGVSTALVVDIVALEDLGADPLDIVTLGIHLERAAGLPPGEAAFEGCATVGDMLALLQSLLAKSGAGAPPRPESVSCS